MLVLAASGSIAYANTAARELLRAPLETLLGVDAELLIAGTRARIPGPGRPLPAPLDSDDPAWQGPAPELAIPGDAPIPVGVRLSCVLADGELYACLSIRTGERSAPAARARIEAAIGRLAPSGRGGVIVIDVDHFELVNQSLGRAGGDRVLADLDLTLHAVSRAGEVAARLEADRFAIVTPQSDGGALSRRADELLEAIRERRIQIADTPVRLTASAGICALDRPRLDVRADRARRRGGDHRRQGSRRRPLCALGRAGTEPGAPRTRLERQDPERDREWRPHPPLPADP